MKRILLATAAAIMLASNAFAQVPTRDDAINDIALVVIASSVCNIEVPDTVWAGVTRYLKIAHLHQEADKEQVHLLSRLYAFAMARNPTVKTNFCLFVPEHLSQMEQLGQGRRDRLDALQRRFDALDVGQR
jgi:hypothetical protein